MSSHTFTRGDGTTVEVEFTIVSYGAPACWTDPAEAPEIEIDLTVGNDGEIVTLAEAELERAEQEICEGDYFDDYDDIGLDE